MSNLDPPRDPLETWEEYGNVRIGARIPGQTDYVMATLTKVQAYDLAASLLDTLGVVWDIFSDVPR